MYKEERTKKVSPSKVQPSYLRLGSPFPRRIIPGRRWRPLTVGSQSALPTEVPGMKHLAMLWRAAPILYQKPSIRSTIMNARIHESMGLPRRSADYSLNYFEAIAVVGASHLKYNQPNLGRPGITAMVVVAPTNANRGNGIIRRCQITHRRSGIALTHACLIPQVGEDELFVFDNSSETLHFKSAPTS